MTQTKKLPKSRRVTGSVPSRCNFYLADDVRVEQGGKPSLLGFYPDNVILMLMPKKDKDPTKEHPAAIGGLAILASFIGARGTYDVEMELFGPGGASILKTIQGQLSSDQENLNFIARFQPMPIIGIGEYKVVIKLNKKPFTGIFYVRRRQPTQGLAGEITFQRLPEEKAKATKKD